MTTEHALIIAIGALSLASLIGGYRVTLLERRVERLERKP